LLRREGGGEYRKLKKFENQGGAANFSKVCHYLTSSPASPPSILTDAITYVVNLRFAEGKQHIWQDECKKGQGV